MEVRWFRGHKKGSKIYHTGDGYYYYKNRVMTGGRISLRCVNAKKDVQCSSRASCSSTGDSFELKSEHNHGRTNLYEIRRLRNSIMARCRSRDTTSFVDIVNQEGQRHTRHVRSKNRHLQLKSAMHRARSSQFPKVPDSIGDLSHLLAQNENRYLTKTLDGEDDIFYGAVGKSSRRTRCIIFMSRRAKDMLQRSTELFADGTWGSRPAKPKTSQVFSICTTVERGNARHVVPLAVVLMKSRTQAAYRVLFEALRNAGCNPDVIHCDFEKAQFNAWRIVFPRARVAGCLYHYVVRLRMKARKERLARLLRRNRFADRVVRSCGALPLLPARLMRTGLRTLLRNAVQYRLFQELRPFLKYVKDKWLVNKEVLCVYGEDNRTNNVSESWNSSMQQAVKVRRPNVFAYIAALVRLEDKTEQMMYDLRHGEVVSRARKASAVANDRRILRYIQNLAEGLITMTDFLRLASRRMQRVWRPLLE